MCSYYIPCSSNTLSIRKQLHVTNIIMSAPGHILIPAQVYDAILFILKCEEIWLSITSY